MTGLAIRDGVLLGLMLSVLIGPVFFLLIRTSIEKGIKEALILDIGVIAGDIFCIWLSYIGTAIIFKDPYYAKILGVIGSIILMVVGLVPLLKKSDNKSEEIKVNTTNHIKLIVKGFALNVTNPFVIFFWIVSVGYSVRTFDAQPGPIFVYFLACIITYLLVDFLKIYLAVKIKAYLTPRTLHKVNQVASIGVMVLGVVLLYRVLMYENI